MVDQDVISFAIVMTTIVGSVASLAVIYVGAKWGLAKTTMKQLPPSRFDDSRLEQIQQTVDSIAIEVERIAEAQRFTAKLANERSESKKLQG
jgi:hypothetical protein